MVLPSAEVVKKYKTAELIAFLKEQDLDLSKTNLKMLEDEEINGRTFLNTSREEFQSLGLKFFSAKDLADLAKEIRLEHKNEQDDADVSHDESDDNDELPNMIENLVLTDQEGIYREA